MDVRPKVTRYHIDQMDRATQGVISCDGDDEVWDALAYVQTLVPNKMTVWVAGSDETDALLDHVGFVDRGGWGCRVVLCAGVDDAGNRWTDADCVGTGEAREN